MWLPPRAYAISCGHSLLDGGREVQVRVVSQQDACPEHCEKHHCEKHHCEKHYCEQYFVRGVLARHGNSRRTRRRVSPVVALCAVAMLIAVTAPTALAQDERKEAAAVPATLVESTTDSLPAAQPHAIAKPALQYFIDFLSRTAASYGHPV